MKKGSARSDQMLGDRHARRWATSCLRQRRPVLERIAATGGRCCSSPPKVPLAGDTSLATIQSQPFAPAWRGRARPPSRSRRRSRRPGAAGSARPATGWRGCRGCPRAPGTAAAASFFSFWAAWPDPPVGDGGGADRDVHRQRRLAGGQHLARGLDMDDGDAGGNRLLRRAADQGHRAPSRASAAAMAWPCLPEERLAM